MSKRVKKPKEIPVKTEEEAAAAEAQIVELSKRIEFYLTEYTIELLANKMRNKDFVVPSYQREYIWKDDRKSRFIESLIMGLPIPFLFFWEMPNGRLEIVDGSQRLRTIEEFVLGDLRLGELDSLTLMSGFKYVDLPMARQRKIKNRSIRGIVLNEHADEQARFDLFDRINTGSQIANPAEVRRGALAGPFMDLLIELADLPQFVELAPVTATGEKERQRDELVTRFFAYGDGLDGYKDRPSEFLFNYVQSMNKRVEQDRTLFDEYRKRFVSTMAFIQKVFPYGFRKTPKGKVTPRARFEAIAIGSKIAIDKCPELDHEDVSDVTTWLNSSEFSKVTGSDGANAIARLRGRINFVCNKLLGQ
jgi:hypothetical protein